eukprot:jgi/Mesen1/7893/ME000420S07035
MSNPLLLFLFPPCLLLQAAGQAQVSSTSSMKVRVRPVSGGATFRVEVPELCDLRTLQERVAAVAGVSVAAARLSLNKREELGGPGNVALSSLGVRGGDLLYLLDASAPSEHASSSSGQHARPQGAPGAGSSGHALVSDVHMTEAPNNAFRIHASSVCGNSSRHAQAQAQARPQAHPPQAGAGPPRTAQGGGAAESTQLRTENANGLAMEEGARAGLREDTEMEDAGGDAPAAGAPAAAPLGAPGWPACGHSSAAGSPSSSSSSSPSSIHGLLQRALAVEGEGLTDAQVLVVAVHALMLETGFVPAAYLSQSHLGLPSGWRAGAGGPITLAYRLPPQPPQGGPASGPGEAADGGRSGLECVVTCQTLGKFLVVYGAVSGPAGGTASPEPVLRVCLPDTYAAGTRAAHGGPSSSGGGGRGAAEHARGGGQSKRARDGSAHARNSVMELWREVKDQLALPLFAALCRRAGRSAPTSLLALPAEVRAMVLEGLPPRALAMLACVCSEFHVAAASDSLWRALYWREFGFEVIPANPPGRAATWKAAFAARWRLRRQQDAQRQRQLAAAGRHARGGGGASVISPRHPYFPAPGVIGGDFDRFPAVGGGFGSHMGGLHIGTGGFDTEPGGTLGGSFGVIPPCDLAADDGRHGSLPRPWQASRPIEEPHLLGDGTAAARRMGLGGTLRGFSVGRRGTAGFPGPGF